MVPGHASRAEGQFAEALLDAPGAVAHFSLTNPAGTRSDFRYNGAPLTSTSPVGLRSSSTETDRVVVGLGCSNAQSSAT